MEKLKTTRILGLVGAILLIVGNFFSLASVSVLGLSRSFTYFEGEGKIVVVLGILDLCFIYLDKIKNALGEKTPSFIDKFLPWSQKAVLVPAIIVALMLIRFSTDSNIRDFNTYIRYGMGYFILWIGVIATAVYPFLYKDEDASNDVTPTADNENK